MTPSHKQRQCAAKTAKGAQCAMPALKGGRYCWSHSPERKAEAQAARRLGGAHRKIARVSGDEPIVIVNVADVLKLVNAVLADVWQLDNSAPRGRVLLACAETARAVLETSDLEQRIVALETERDKSKRRL
jgi:hypothetical protein